MPVIELLREQDRTWFELVMASTQLLALFTIPSVLLRRRGRPKAALSWLLALFAVPVLGVLAWWAVGRTSIERRKRRRALSTQSFSDKHAPLPSESGTPFEGLVPARAFGESVFASSENSVELCIDGKEAFPAMERAIMQARHSVDIQFYIWRNDETGRRFRDLCAEKAREGVAVRVLIDAWGSTRFVRALRRPLLEAGAEFAVFMPSRLYPIQAPRLNFVNHRKILVVDGRVGFTGGMNIGDEYAREWRDLMVRVEGPCVRALEHVFLDDWYFATGKSLESAAKEPARNGGVACAVIASGPDREAWIHDAYFVAFTRAKERIWVVTPYFIPSVALVAALRTAAGRGVDVRIVLPSLTDVLVVQWASRSYYPELLTAGVRIYEYAGAVLHAKGIIVDDEWSSVGSANIDTRSFLLSFEISCLFSDRATNVRLTHWCEGLMHHSTEMSLEELERRSTLQKTLESAAHLLSPLL